MRTKLIEGIIYGLAIEAIALLIIVALLAM